MTSPPEPTPRPPGTIVTFYSYKGGTGRSMALANVAWLLASSGKRVLAVDWDLEAPGLHRYFQPFLADPSLEQSTGVIDFVREFATAAVSAPAKDENKDWYKDYANLLAHAVPVTWTFTGGGRLDFVPAGKQDAAYAVRVNSFDWQEFYERLGGGVLLEAVKDNLRGLYDYVLIDSRTGISDTSGVCTVQMPDQLVVCFTLNKQSIYGAAAAARSAHRQRRSASGAPTLKVWPVPTRIDHSEKERLEVAFAIARARFSSLAWQLDPAAEEDYWASIGVEYEPYYAYEEVLAALRDRPRRGSMASTIVTIAGYLNGEPLPRIEDPRRAEGLEAFLSRSARDSVEELTLLGTEYENIRERLEASDQRTFLMTGLVERARTLAGKRDAAHVAEQLFRLDTAGGRIVALALAQQEPQRQQVEMALSAISESRSAFEQFHGLVLVELLHPKLEPQAARQLRTAISAQIGRTILASDPSRQILAERLLGRLEQLGQGEWSRRGEVLSRALGPENYAVIECHATTSTVRYDDVVENHGPYVVTRGGHHLNLPRVLRLGRGLVTNSFFQAFVAAGGYHDDSLWTLPPRVRKKFVTKDGMSPGPASWIDSHTARPGREDHPVTSISVVEARAFVNWCNRLAPEEGWVWSLPPEDHWEYVARSESALIYPWGDAFDSAKCNSAENGGGVTTPVSAFENGASPFGCLDMAGNVWEFVEATDAGKSSCVLRGGSYLNNRYEMRSYLRLKEVPETKRAPDFGFRLAQVAR
jgi:hypothetical protein